MASRLILYTTEGCHLCEHAEQLLAQLKQSETQLQLTPVDIATDEALVELYGIRIPVVKNELTQDEIGWPFDLSDLVELINPA